MGVLVCVYECMCARVCVLVGLCARVCFGVCERVQVCGCVGTGVSEYACRFVGSLVCLIHDLKPFPRPQTQMTS